MKMPEQQPSRYAHRSNAGRSLYDKLRSLLTAVPTSGAINGQNRYFNKFLQGLRLYKKQ